MRYNRRNPNGMGYERDFGLQPPRYEEGPRMQPLPPVSQLSPSEERLLELSQYVGQLEGQNDLLNQDNIRLEENNRSLVEKNEELRKRNVALGQSIYKNKGASDLVDEIEAELTSRKEKKVSK